MKANLKILWIAVFALCFGVRVGHAGPVGPLTTFTSGTPAVASEVNGNFSAVKTAVDDNAAHITTLETRVTPAGNIVLVPSTATAGNILKGTAPFIHNFGTSNTFIGENAGNFTMTDTGNTASGSNALHANTTGFNNTASGVSAIENNTTGQSNTAGGAFALRANTTGNQNTASGAHALQFNTTGGNNTAGGANALLFNTTGGSNTASGSSALSANTTGDGNTATGASALQSNTTGSNTTATGFNALRNNTTGGLNTAHGSGTLQFNTAGLGNTAVGAGALNTNTTGNANTAIGSSALSASIGESNTASGAGALILNTTGGSNTASGVSSLRNNTTGSTNTAIGDSALFNNTTGTNNIAIGVEAGFSLTTGNANIAIGNAGVAGESITLRIGALQTRAFIAGIRGVTTATAAIPVLVGTDGQLGTASSSRHVKDDIADMGKASSALMKLRPVTFYYKSDKDPKGRTLQYGLVAEEVAKVAPGLVAHSANGRIETVYYQFLAPMLLNEVQKQQRTIDTQAARIAELEQDRQAQTARVEALEKQAARLAGVLARLEQAGMITAAAR